MPLASKSHPSQRGFALIVTVVLVAFLVLILVGLAIFTRVETQVATNTDIQARARQNALAGLNVAVGQLQRHAGQDRRISARGDLSTLTVSAEFDKRKNLTGIWDADDTYSPGDEPLVWLVSGSETNSPANTVGNEVVDPGIATPDPDDDVVLIGNNTVEDDDDRIIVKKQPIEAPAGSILGLTTAEPIGHYAYWVGDEGVKASLSLVDSSRASAPAPNYAGTSNWTNDRVRERLSMQMLPQPQLQNFNPTIGLDVRNAATVDGLAKVTNNDALRFVNGFAPNTAAAGAQRLRELFHDITPRAEAVLADLATGDGRLKRDLSDPGAGIRPALVQTYLSAAPVATTDYSATYNVTESAFPVITEGSIRVTTYIDGNDIKLAYIINVEVWNPYAATLQVINDGDGIDGASETPSFIIEVAGLPVDVDIVSNGTTPTNVPDLDLDGVLSGNGPGTFVSASLNTGLGGLTWTPGQFRQLYSSAAGRLSATAGPSAVVSPTTYPLSSPDATELTVDVASILNTLEFRLKLGTTVVATYKPGTTFTAANYTTTATLPTSYNFGFGYQLEDNVEIWARDRDPRDAAIPSNFVNVTWLTDPSSNTGAFDNGDLFREAGSPIVLFDLPRQEVMSVGELRHVVGGSGNAVPYRTNTDWYDEYFFSTVPQAGWTVDDIATQPLPNRYIRLIRPLQRVAAVDADLRGNGDENARFFLQTGAFNINSTSVNAWRAMLGARIFGWAYDNGGGATADLQHAFFRVPHGAQFLSNRPLLQTSINDPEDVMYVGGRDLTDDEVNVLARAIVDRIRARRVPSFTLRQFINDGVISDAIEQVVTLNPPLDPPLTPGSRINAGLAPSRLGTPGELTQTDILAALAPAMTARSDTFRIRAYGDVFNPVTERVEGRAWCEAVVQRVPDLAEDLGATDADVADPVFNNTTNRFGRKFVIVSFRWLSPSDI